MSLPGDLLSDRIRLNAALIVLCFVAVLLLESQSAASYPSYLLALSMVASAGRWNDVLQVPLSWLLLGLLGSLTVSALWSEPFYWRDAASTLVRALLVLLFVVAFAECQLRGELRRWLGRAMALVGTVAVAAALVAFFATDPPDGRLNGLGQLDTHVIAALVYAVVLLLVLDVALTDGSRVWRLVAVVCALLIAWAIFLSDSRNAWFSTLTGVGVFLLARGVRDPQRFVAAVAAFAVVLAALVAVLAASDATRHIVLPRGDSFRIAIWQHVLERIAAGGPWLGLGINTADDVLVAGERFFHPHNLYLAVAHQGGLVALALLLWLLAASIRRLLRRYRDDDAKLALGILGLALPAYLLDGHELVDKVGSTWFLLWLPVAISLGLTWSEPRAWLPLRRWRRHSPAPSGSPGPSAPRRTAAPGAAPGRTAGGATPDRP